MKRERAATAGTGPGRGACAAALAVALLFAAPVPVRAQTAAERFAACLACHGEGGVSRLAETPSLAGQPSFYAITQLFLFREGRRTNETMTAMAKGMSDADLRAFSELIGRLPPMPPADPAPADSQRMLRGAALAQRSRCTSCHGADLAGDKQIPRLAGQREDYLARTLAEFRTGKRIGYTQAMNEALAGLGPGELADLAHYLSHLPLANAPAAASAASR